MTAGAEEVVVVVAAGVGVGGMLSDTGVVRPNLVRLVAPALGALLVVAVGWRLQITGLAGIDAAATVAWILVMTNAVRLLDVAHRDASVAGVVVFGVAASLGLAGSAGGQAPAALALGLVGSLIAFAALCHPRQPLRLGEGGRLFLGFLLSVAVVKAQPALGPTTRLALPALLATAALTGRRTPVDPSQPTRQHSKGSSLTTLLGAQLLLGAGGAIADGGVLGSPWSGLLVVGMVGGVTAAMRPVAAWRRMVRQRGRLGWAVSGAGLAVLALTLAAMVVLALAAGPAAAGSRAADRAVRAARQGQTQQAVAEFSKAEEAFRQAEGRLSGVLPSLAGVVPVVSSNLRAARTLTEGGVHLARTGGRLAARASVEQLRFRGGGVPLDEVRRIRPELAAAAAVTRSTSARVDRIERTFLVPPLRRASDEAAVRLRGIAGDAQVAADAARLVPDIFGGGGPRRYFLAVQNNAEARATGGLIGDFGELVAEGGKLRLDRFGPIGQLNDAGVHPRVLHAPQDYVDRYGRFEPQDTWQNVNFSPDFPTVAKVIVDLYPQSGGQPVDGVIAIDPEGLASLLKLSGPVSVPGWPERISRSNVVDVSLRQAYERFSDRAVRRGFLGEVASEVVRDISTSDLGDPGHITGALGPGVRRRHLLVYLARSDEQRLIERLGAAGKMATPRSDSLMAVNQNAAGNKVDYYLRRRLRYEVRLTPSGREAGVTGKLDVTLENGAPTVGLPPYVLGPTKPRFAPGENFTYLSVYTPLDFSGARLDGRPSEVEEGSELGRKVYSTFLSVPSGSTRTLSLRLGGTLPLDGGWYTLELPRQPLLAPDQMDLVVSAPAGWGVAEAQGLTVRANHAEGHLVLDADKTVRVRLERTG